MNRQRVRRLALGALAALVSAGFVLPLVWMFLGSVKAPEESLSAVSALQPSGLGSMVQHARENYLTGRPPFVDENGNARLGFDGVLNSRNVDFLLFMRNTVIVAVLAVTGMVLSSAVVAYGFAKIRWRGRNVLFAIVLATMMVPFPATMVPTYFLFKYIGWIGTLKPLWAPAWFAGAFNVFLLRQFFLQVPDDLCDAARLDGLGHWGIFRHIMLPLARPALAVVAVFHFIYVWNDFLGPLVFLHHQEQYTLSLGLQFYTQQHGGTPWNLLMAACTITVAPVLLLYLVAQRMISGGSELAGQQERSSKNYVTYYCK